MVWPVIAQLDDWLATLDPKDYARLAASIKLKQDEVIDGEFLQEIITPNYIGPTWQKDEDGDWLLPEHTLGWQIAAWCTKWILDPRDPEKPWKFTSEQLRFILWWYAVDEHGQFIYRSGVLQRRKGWGKDPLLAVMCLVEMVGPSRFHSWLDGEPVGKPERSALIVISAVTKEQTSNTGDMFPLLMSDAMIKEFKIKPGIELIRAHEGKQKIQLITGSYRAVEGKRATFSVLNETHHWIVANGGVEMYKTIDGNAAKLSNRYLAITNAYLPGEDSVGEMMRDDWMRFTSEGMAGAFLYDSVEAKARAPIGGPLLPFVLTEMIGDSTWTKVDAVIFSMMKASISAARSRRMWLNQIVADEDAIHGPETWDILLDESLYLTRNDEIVLGLDGGKSDDSTALIAIRPKDMAVFVIGIWEKPIGTEGDGWMVDHQEVADIVDRTHVV